ncbi:hypothetical protein DSM25559_4363 [Agrobacterium rosae]|uniref:Uncharacterized protein n=1 Tax=Agrobacterium rosae TaxID=1972867 RepID=A0A1R3U0A1_9HYPH|nr:hypothetical protein DSM25559_4363 [Agrobacterium rosae]
MARLRFFLTSDHTPEQIVQAVKLTDEILQDLTQRNVGLGSLDMQQVAKLFT